MPGLLDRLRTALADRYTLERELGVGGMATVGSLRHECRAAMKRLGAQADTLQIFHDTADLQA